MRLIRHRFSAQFSLVAAILAAAPLLVAQTPNLVEARDKTLHFIRVNFKIPETVKLTLTDLKEGDNPDFYVTTVLLDDGKDKRSQTLSVTKDLHYLVEGNIFKTQAAGQSDMREKVFQCVREHYDIPAASKITMTDLHDTVFTDFYATMITVDDGKEKKVRPFYVSRNLHDLVQAGIYSMDGESRKEVLRLISLDDQPSQGPANAPVTLVEYSDLACPHCALLQESLESEIIPKYGDKLRVVFKEFPLVTVHDWSLTGSIAAQCVYQIDPANYPAFRSVVFKSQELVTGENARDMMLHFGAEAGVDNMKLAACVDSKATLGRVVQNMLEGNAVGVGETPTSFINGRMITGDQSAADFYKVIDEAQHDPK